MTFDQFHNGLRVLLNIDSHEFYRAISGSRLPDPVEISVEWKAFRDDPHGWFIRAPDAKAKAIWKIVEERTGCNTDPLGEALNSGDGVYRP